MYEQTILDFDFHSIQWIALRDRILLSEVEVIIDSSLYFEPHFTVLPIEEFKVFEG